MTPNTALMRDPKYLKWSVIESDKGRVRNGGYNAYTDGVIRARSGRIILSIVEEKRVMRDGNRETEGVYINSRSQVAGLIHSRLAVTLPVLNRALSFPKHVTQLSHFRFACNMPRCKIVIR